MFELVCFIIVVAVIWEILKFLATPFIWLGDVLGPRGESFIVFINENHYLILGVVCFVFSFFYLVYFKPHQAEKYFKQYQKNIITKQEAITKIGDTLYRPTQGIPSALDSRIRVKRIRALRKRVRAEEAFIRDLKSYIRTKES